MSSFDEAYRNGQDNDLTQADWFPAVSRAYPSIAALLIGEPDWKRNTQQRPPFTMMLAVRNGRLRATFSHFDRKRMLHVAISEPANVLGSIEDALVKGEIETSDREERGTRR